jgi:BMFP domain-containing protein YqiC
MSGFDGDLQVARGLVKTIQQNMARRDRLRREGGSAGALNGSKTRDQLAKLEKRLDTMERQLNQAARSPADYGV